jgi:hypothetical protein
MPNLVLTAIVCVVILGNCHLLGAGEMPWVVVSSDKTGFVLEPGGKPFHPWGFNYDHDDSGRLLEDYWDSEWPAVEAHFARMKKLGANVVRIHLQFGKFMDDPDKGHRNGKPNVKALDRLSSLVGLAEKERLYLDLTGLGCYHKKDVPAWYDKLSEKEGGEIPVNLKFSGLKDMEPEAVATEFLTRAAAHLGPAPLP